LNEALIEWMERPIEICDARRKHSSAKMKGEKRDLAPSAIEMRAATFAKASTTAAAAARASWDVSSVTRVTRVSGVACRNGTN
jgi:hypothetical protein